MSLLPLRFATLTPENKAAQKCLASLVDSQPPESPVHLVAVAQADGPTKSTDRAARSKYQLMLSFNARGSSLDRSWLIGKLRRRGAPDLPICSSRSRHLRGWEACKLSIHPQSGALLLWNISQHHSIVYLQANGSQDVELQYNDGYVLHKNTNRLRIGPLDFVLEFSVRNEVAYSTHLEDYMRRQYQGWDHHRRIQEYGCLDVLPRPTQLDMGNIILHHIISKGAFGVVRAGIEKQTGKVVACKTIHLHHHDISATRNEIEIARQIPPRSVGLVPLLSSWCEHGHPFPCSQAVFEDVHLLMPYAPFTFASAPWHEIDLLTRLVLYRQVLEGLKNLHSMGIMHRDISPQNLLVFSCQAPPASAAAICDFGKAKKALWGTKAALGPLSFTAPEVGHQEKYTNAIDIFSLGLSIVATFLPWVGARALSRDHHTRILESLAAGLQGRIPDSLKALLRSMVAWEPSGRPTAEEALADPAWEQTAVAEQPVLEDEQHQSSSGETSRARRGRRSGGPSITSSHNMNRKRAHESSQPAMAGASQSGANKKKKEMMPTSQPSGQEGVTVQEPERSDGPCRLSPPPQ
ncbi:kinase-like protein [Cryphonectria parasitica EP155]|uniref:EKC/KEOPS complex subunit BUD32 n=1 Tax=Cryphonectria parasitica (strain ATCC 38755 / EP155) TaxID=660469 RepID=A0A9P4XZC5_CRYP1|nr:kinase-like protein [Cryphonectria parasitica EP155]KAF3763557.1 kinase-like protein [Cryphonectria parasitica EP155]